MNTQLRLHRIISLMVVSAMLAMTSLGAAPVQPASARVIVQGVSVEQAAAAMGQGRVDAAAGGGVDFVCLLGAGGLREETVDHHQ